MDFWKPALQGARVDTRVMASGVYPDLNLSSVRGQLRMQGPSIHASSRPPNNGASPDLIYKRVTDQWGREMLDRVLV
jgi:hypothetical protein